METASATPASAVMARKVRGASRPSNGISPDATVSARVLRSLVELVEQTGASSEPLLRVANLSLEQLHNPQQRVPRATLYTLCEQAIQLTGDAALGMHWAERLSSSSLAPLSQLLAHAPSLRSGFDALARFSCLLSDSAGFRIVETDTELGVYMIPLHGESARLQRFVAEMMMTGFVCLLRDVSSNARPESVCFSYPAPSVRSEYDRVFGQLAHFEQPFTGIVFNRALLELPTPERDDDVHEALLLLAERRLWERSERAPHGERVLEFLVRAGGPYQTDMPAAARALGMSVRSLRRRLDDEGSSYQAIAQDALLRVAKNALIEQRRSIQETAFLMGFSDARTFHRAFRRWTGMTPTEFRRQAGGFGTDV